MIKTPDIDLITQAWKARERAYAPYSNFAVGAAVLDGAGHVYTGCNVENLSFGLTMCAERVAVGRWIVEGGRDNGLIRIAVVADTAEPISPCGACRQVLAEYNPACELLLVNREGTIQRFSLTTLLPRAATGILDRCNLSTPNES